LAVTVVEDFKVPLKWQRFSFHLFLKEYGDLGGMFPRVFWYFGTLISGRITEQLIAINGLFL
jgi:hypothetical protein